MDAQTAFMAAPLPEHQTAVVRPPQIWVELGTADPGTRWLCHMAIYGLRVSPPESGAKPETQNSGPPGGAMEAVSAMCG